MNFVTQKLGLMDEELRLYALHHLPAECIQTHEFERVEQLLTSFDFLEAKIDILRSEDGVNQLLKDYTGAIAAHSDIHGIFPLLANAIRLSALILAEDAKQTFPQIYSRLLSEQTAAVRTLLDNYMPAYSWLRMRSKTMFTAKSALIRTLAASGAEVLACAVSDDAHLALFASSDQTLKIWNLETGLCEQVLQGHTDTVNSCALSADGKLALSASTDTTLRLWETKTGQCLHVFAGHSGKVTACALSDDGTYFLSSSYDQTVRLWDVQTKTCVILPGHEERVSCCALSGDGRLALSGSYDQTLRLWDVATHECLKVINDESGGITHCALSYDGQLALSSSVSYLIEFENRDPVTGDTPVVLFVNSTDKEESELKAGSDDHPWNVLLHVVENAGITSEILHRDSVISVWDVSSGKYLGDLEHQGTVSCLSFMKNGKRLLSSTDSGELKIWDMETGEHVASLFETTGGVSSCAIDRVGNTAISSTYYGALYVWDLSLAMKNAQMGQQEPGRGAIFWCQYHPAGDLAFSVSDNRTIQQWNVQTGDLASQTTIAELPNWGEIDVSISRQIALAASSSLGFTDQETKELKVVDLQGGQLIQILSGHTDWISACAIDKEGKIAISADREGIVRIWDLEDYSCRFVLEGHEDYIGCCALDADGLRALSGSEDTTLRVWDTQTGHCLYILQGHTQSVKGCAFSSNGKRALSVGDDNALCLWDLSSGTLLHKRKFPVELSAVCTLNSDGKLALYITSERTIHLVEIEIEREIATFTFDISINALALSPQGKNVMAGDSSGHVHFLDIEEKSPSYF